MTDTAIASSQPLNTMLGFRFVSVKELSEEEKNVLKNSVAKGTTDDELSYFLNVAFAQELNPFQKEVWCVKYGQNLMIQTARDGFLKIAKRDPSFDRIQSAEVREGDHFVMDPVSGEIEHRFGPKRGQIMGAYAVITRKDGTKLSKYVTFTEYVDGSSSIWKDYPSAMICKCAESVLCKQFANVTGIVAEETMRKDGTVIDSSPSAQAQQSSLKDELIKQIEGCTTLEEFTTVRNAIAGTVGKLFGPEKDAVFAAAKKKRAELEALDNMTPNEIRTAVDLPPIREGVVNHKDGNPHNSDVSNLEIVDAVPQDAPQMDQAEFDSWAEGLKAQETQEGVLDCYRAATEKPMSPDQKAAFETLRDECKKALEPKRHTKKKVA